MNKKLIVYDWKIIGQDEDFRKYKKVIFLELNIDNFPYAIGTEIKFDNGNLARHNKLTIDIVNNTEIYEAVAINKWIM